MKKSKLGYKRYSPDVKKPYNVIPSGRITMQDVDFPVFGIDDMGNEQMMYPGGEYQFPGSQVFEVPVYQQGGTRKPIYTSNPNDPRLKSYQDSLILYNYTKGMVDDLKGYERKYGDNEKIFVDQWTDYTKDWYKTKNSKVTPSYDRLTKKNKQAPKPEKTYESRLSPNQVAVEYKKPVQPVIFEQKATKTNIAPKELNMPTSSIRVNRSVNFPKTVTGIKYDTQKGDVIVGISGEDITMPRKEFDIWVNKPENRELYNEYRASQSNLNRYQRGQEVPEPFIRPDFFTPAQIRQAKINLAQNKKPLTTEGRINEMLGDPKSRAADLSQKAAPEGEGPVDNIRHTVAGMYTADAIANKLAPYPMGPTTIPAKALGFVGSNLAGLAHEVKAFVPSLEGDYRNIPAVARMSAEDMINNFVGSALSLNPFMTEKEKEDFIVKMSYENYLPDGYVQIDPKHSKDLYFKKQYGGDLEEFGSGGLKQWFDEKWVDVKTGKECGRSGKDKDGRPYPACRPSRRVNSTTPKTTSEMSSSEKAKFKREKTSGKRIDYNHKRAQAGLEVPQPYIRSNFFSPQQLQAAEQRLQQDRTAAARAYATPATGRIEGEGLIDAVLPVVAAPMVKAVAKPIANVADDVISNAWKVNPRAYQYNLPENTMWRGLGKEGMEDALQSGVFRAKQDVVPIYYPGTKLRLNKSFGSTYFTPKFKTAATYGDNFLAEVSRGSANWTNRYKRSDWSQMADRQIPIAEGSLLQNGWWRGYKPVEYQKGGQMSASAGYDSWYNSPMAAGRYTFNPKDPAEYYVEGYGTKQGPGIAAGMDYTNPKFRTQAMLRAGLDPEIGASLRAQGGYRFNPIDNRREQLTWGPYGGVRFQTEDYQQGVSNQLGYNNLQTDLAYGVNARYNKALANRGRFSIEGDLGMAMGKRPEGNLGEGLDPRFYGAVKAIYSPPMYKNTRNRKPGPTTYSSGYQMGGFMMPEGLSPAFFTGMKDAVVDAFKSFMASPDEPVAKPKPTDWRKLSRPEQIDYGIRQIVALEDPKNRKAVENLLQATAYMENTYGTNPKAYGRNYTSSFMSIDPIALTDMFTGRGNQGAYNAAQQRQFENFKKLNLPTDKNKFNQLLREDNPVAAMAAARYRYALSPQALPDPNNSRQLFDYWLKNYNGNGILKYKSREEAFKDFQKAYQKAISND